MSCPVQQEPAHQPPQHHESLSLADALQAKQASEPSSSSPTRAAHTSALPTKLSPEHGSANSSTFEGKLRGKVGAGGGPGDDELHGIRAASPQV